MRKIANKDKEVIDNLMKRDYVSYVNHNLKTIGVFLDVSGQNPEDTDSDIHHLKDLGYRVQMLIPS